MEENAKVFLIVGGIGAAAFLLFRRSSGGGVFPGQPNQNASAQRDALNAWSSLAGTQDANQTKVALAQIASGDARARTAADISLANLKSQAYLQGVDTTQSGQTLRVALEGLFGLGNAYLTNPATDGSALDIPRGGVVSVGDTYGPPTSLYQASLSSGVPGSGGAGFYTPTGLDSAPDYSAGSVDWGP